MLSRVCLAAAAALVFAYACAACVGDDTVASPSVQGTQGGSGPPPSSYGDSAIPPIDATLPPEDAGEDAPSGDATVSGDASDATSPGDAGSDVAAPG